MLIWTELAVLVKTFVRSGMATCRTLSGIVSGSGPSTAEPPSGIVSVGKKSGRFTSTAASRVMSTMLVLSSDSSRYRPSPCFVVAIATESAPVAVAVSSGISTEPSLLAKNVTV